MLPLKLMLMPDVPVTVPLAGLHPCAGFEAETDAVAAVGESRALVVQVWGLDG